MKTDPPIRAIDLTPIRPLVSQVRESGLAAARPAPVAERGAVVLESPWKRKARGDVVPERASHALSFRR